MKKRFLHALSFLLILALFLKLSLASALPTHVKVEDVVIEPQKRNEGYAVFPHFSLISRAYAAEEGYVAPTRNFLERFVDSLINFFLPMPTVSVPTPAPAPVERIVIVREEEALPSSQPAPVITNIITSSLPPDRSVTNVYNTYTYPTSQTIIREVRTGSTSGLARSVSNSVDGLEERIIALETAPAPTVFTTADARLSLSETISGIDYDNTTGIFSTTSGYNVPLTASTTNWNNFYDTPSSRITAGTGLSWTGNTLNSSGVSANGLNELSVIAVGNNNATTTLGVNASVFGYCNTASANYSSAFGSNINNSTANSVEIGADNTNKLQISSSGVNWTGGGGFCVNGTNVAVDVNNLSPIQVGCGNSAGSCGVALGRGNTAGTFGYVFGADNTACGIDSSAGGYLNTASGPLSAAFGYLNTASGTNSSAFGNNNNVASEGSAFGRSNNTAGGYSSASGYANNACGNNSSAFGLCNTASGNYSSASGYLNTASGSFSSAFGYLNTASGCFSSAFGSNINNSTANSVEIGAANAEKLQISSTGVNFVTAGSGSFSVNGSEVGRVVSSTVTTISQTNPAVVTTSLPHSLSNADRITISGGDMTEVNNVTHYAKVLTATTFELYSDQGLTLPVDSSAYTAYSSGGSMNHSFSLVGINNLSPIAVGFGNSACGIGSTASGYFNTASGYRSSAFGSCNIASGNFSSASGYLNTASFANSSAFGNQNNATCDFASAFGYLNTASGYCSSAFGYLNNASSSRSSAFGYGNTASGSGSSASGYLNTASGCFNSAVGYGNTTSGDFNNSAIGSLNTACGNCSSAVGYSNFASSYKDSAFGTNNTASGCFSSAFGSCNTASGCYSSASGFYNTANNILSSVGGALNNRSGVVIDNSGCCITCYGAVTTAGIASSAFGIANQATGLMSTAVGYCNTASGNYSSAFGSCLTNSAASSTMIGFDTSWFRMNGDNSADFSNGALLTAGGDFTNASDRNIKENFTDLDSDDVLNKINALNIQQWNYKAEDASITHIGPMAQDFYAAFSLGGSDKSISTIDPAGVALIGIQALSKEQASTTLALNSLTLRLNDLIPISATSTDPSTSSWFVNTLESFGASIVDGIVHFMEVFIEKLNISHLIIKDSTDVHQTGYVIYDRATGEPICVYFENGVQKTEEGDCDTPANTNIESTNTDSGSDEENTETTPSEPDTSDSPTDDTTDDAPVDDTLDPEPEVVEPEVTLEPEPEPEVVSEPEPTPEPAPEPESEPEPTPAPADASAL